METGTHPHLLIIEDDVLLNDMTKRLLTQHGYCVTSAYSGSEALLLLYCSVSGWIDCLFS